MHDAQCGKLHNCCWHVLAPCCSSARRPVCTTSPYNAGCGGLATIAQVMTRAIHGAAACCATCNAIAMQRSLTEKFLPRTMHAEHTSTGIAVCECTPTCLLAVLAVVQPPHWRFKVMHATRALTRDGCHACAALICSALLLHALHV